TTLSPGSVPLAILRPPRWRVPAGRVGGRLARNQRGLGGARGFHAAQDAFDRLVCPPPAVSRQRPADGSKRPALLPFAQGFFGLRPFVQEVPVRPVGFGAVRHGASTDSGSACPGRPPRGAGVG